MAQFLVDIFPQRQLILADYYLVLCKALCIPLRIYHPSEILPGLIVWLPDTGTCVMRPGLLFQREEGEHGRHLVGCCVLREGQQEMNATGSCRWLTIPAMEEEEEVTRGRLIPLLLPICIKKSFDGAPRRPVRGYP